MIKLTRNTAPDKLTEEFVKKGTEKYAEFNLQMQQNSD